LPNCKNNTKEQEDNMNDMNAKAKRNKIVNKNKETPTPI